MKMWKWTGWANACWMKVESKGLGIRRYKVWRGSSVWKPEYGWAGSVGRLNLLPQSFLPSLGGRSLWRVLKIPLLPLSLLLQPASSESAAGSSLSWESGVFVVCRLDDRRQNNLLLHSCLRPSWSCWQLNKSFWEILFMDLADKAGCSRVADG